MSIEQKNIDIDNKYKDWFNALKEPPTVKETQAKIKELKGKEEDILSIEEELGTPPTYKKLHDKLNQSKDGYKTGYIIETGDEQEEITLKSGAITIISAPTKHGKTTALFNFLLQAIENHKEETHYFFSYEESISSLLPKIASGYINKELSKNNYKTLRHFYKDTKEPYKYLSKKSDEIALEKSNKEFWEAIKNTRVVYQNYTIDKLVEIINVLGNKKDTGVIFIDYLQLIPTDAIGSRHEVIKEVCNKLKDVAVTHDLAIVIASQFNRKATNPDEVAPHNLSEGSDIEKSANQIIGLWNFGKQEKYSNGDNTVYKEYCKLYDKNAVLMKILANRDGVSDIATVFKCDYNIKRIYTETAYSTTTNDNIKKIGLEGKDTSEIMNGKKETGSTEGGDGIPKAKGFNEFDWEKDVL